MYKLTPSAKAEFDQKLSDMGAKRIVLRPGYPSTVWFEAFLKANGFEATPDQYRQVFSLMKLGLQEVPICPTCKVNKVSFIAPAGMFREFCSVSCSVKSDVTSAKRRSTSMEKYGSEHHLQNSEVIKKREQNSLTKHGVTHPSKLDTHRTRMQAYWKSAPVSKNTFISKTEVFLIEELKRMAPHLTFLPTYRKVPGVGEIDIFCPELNLGIEVNGVHYHSEKYKPKLLHENKKMCAYAQAVTLLQFWDDQINNQTDIVLSMISSKAGLNNKVYARKCKVVNLDAHQTALFFSENHLQGSPQMHTSKALEIDEQIVAAMIIGKPRMTKGCDHELLRYANIKGTTVVGGFSKLLKSFNLTGKMVSYADRMFSDGNVYLKNGFTLSHVSPPSYFYEKSKNTRISRYQAQKHKLPALLGDRFDPSESEHVNMNRNGYFRVYDCGTSVWTIELA